MAKLLARPDMTRLPLACCKLYISDGRNRRVLQAIEAAADSHPEAPLLHVFEDHEYNRVGYTLAGYLSSEYLVVDPNKSKSILNDFNPLPHKEERTQEMYTTACSLSESPPIQRAVIEVVEAALRNIDLGEHCGSHPRLGAVDHICIHPLGTATLEEVASLAQSLAAEIGSTLQVPSFLYGAAHHAGRPLDAIRRSLGYFEPNMRGQWTGSTTFPTDMLPDFGPSTATTKSGVVVVGACPWVMNYNVPLESKDLAAGRRIARRVSARGGGLRQVQAMALPHGEMCVEIACNLLDTEVVGPQMVQTRVTRLAESEGITAKEGYLTGYSDKEVLQLALEKIFSQTRA